MWKIFFCFFLISINKNGFVWSVNYPLKFIWTNKFHKFDLQQFLSLHESWKLSKASFHIYFRLFSFSFRFETRNDAKYQEAKRSRKINLNGRNLIFPRLLELLQIPRASFDIRLCDDCETANSGAPSVVKKLFNIICGYSRFIFSLFDLYFFFLSTPPQSPTVSGVSSDFDGIFFYR